MHPRTRNSSREGLSFLLALFAFLLCMQNGIVEEEVEEAGYKMEI